MNASAVGAPVAQEIGVIPAAVSKLTAVQVVALIFSAGLMFATLLLGIQYMVRYRKYHIAQADDQDSLADPSGTVNTAQPTVTLDCWVIVFALSHV